MANGMGNDIMNNRVMVKPILYGKSATLKKTIPAIANFHSMLLK